jgi:hypothetical protein
MMLLISSKIPLQYHQRCIPSQPIHQEPFSLLINSPASHCMENLEKHHRTLIETTTNIKQFKNQQKTFSYFLGKC